MKYIFLGTIPLKTALCTVETERISLNIENIKNYHELRIYSVIHDSALGEKQPLRKYLVLRLELVYANQCEAQTI